MSETVVASSSREQRARRSNQTTTTTSDINRDTTRLATSNLADACRYLSLDRSIYAPFPAQGKLSMQLYNKADELESSMD